MAFTHSVGTTYKNDAGTLASVNASYTGNNENDLSVSVAASTTLEEHDIAVTLSKIKSLAIYSDQAVVLKTNSGTSLADTLSLAAKQLIVWTNDMLTAKPFSTDVTKVFITNSGLNAASVQIRILQTV